MHRLKFVPFDRIKIDKDIIQNLDFEEKSFYSGNHCFISKSLQCGYYGGGVETKSRRIFSKVPSLRRNTRVLFFQAFIDKSAGRISQEGISFGGLG